MKILMLNSARRWIGEAAHTLALAEGLEQRGHCVYLGVRHGHELEQRAAEKQFPRIVSLHFNSKFNPLTDISDLLKIRRLVRDEHIDLIHCHRGKDHWLAVLASRAMRHAPPLIRTRHVVTPAARHLINRWLYSFGTQGLIAVSRAAWNSLGNLADSCPHGKIIYSSVDSGKFRPELRSEEARQELGCRPDTILVGLIGRFQRVKGQRDFIRAAAMLKDRFPQMHFLMAGRGSDGHIRGLRGIAQQAGLEAERYTLLGILPDVARVMASLDIGVIASVGSEGSSRALLEYMGCALPCVATRVGGNPGTGSG